MRAGAARGHGYKPTQESNASQIGAFLGRKAAYRASGRRGDGLRAINFERTPAGIRDHHAGKLDLPPPHPHGLPMRRGEPVVDQVG
jgi:hypothetical protein